MHRIGFILCLSGLVGCATIAITDRAADDLNCDESSIQLDEGAAGLVHATGCGQWIDYACLTADYQTTCTEQRRGWSGGAAKPAPRPEGSELAACFGNQTCFAPLVCIQSICVRPAGPRRLGGSCVEGKCEGSLACVNHRCEPPVAKPIPAVGTKGGACYPNETCNTGLQCQSRVCG